MLGCVVKSSSAGPFETSTLDYVGDTSEFISERAMSVLSRAAKRTVCKQQQSLVKSGSPWKPMTARPESRRRVERRSHASSAPPMTRPPLIVIEEASTERKSDEDIQLDDQVIESPDPVPESLSAPPTAPGLENGGLEKQWDEQKVVVMERVCSPPNYPTRLTRPRYQTPPIKPRSRSGFSRPTTTDWDWVRTKLLSRDSVKRPESSMTFDDFLDCLDPDSDEYDTDLEESFCNEDVKPYDPTGVWHYKHLCKIKGVVPAHQILQKLEKRNIQFKLNHRYMNVADTATLAEGLKHSEYIQNLDLSGNCISDQGAKHIADFMRDNRQIYRLDLSENCLRCDAGRYLAQMILHNRHLTTLRLRKNKLGDKEALLLSEVLRLNRTLRSLDVSHNQLGDDAGEAIAAMLMDNKTLLSLDLSWNSLRKRAAAAIARGLDINRTLVALDLSWNGIGDDGAALLGRTLKENSALRFLSLAVNHICGYGAEQFANGVSGGVTVTKRKKERKARMGRTKCGLQYLNLDRNPLGSRGIKLLLTRLSKEKKLKTLSIREVVLNDDILKQIEALIKTSSKDVTLLYEGQDQLAQTELCMTRAIRILNTALQSLNVKILDVINALDVGGLGANVSDLRNVLAEYAPLTELEIEYVARDLDLNNDGIIQYNDVAVYSRGTT